MGVLSIDFATECVLCGASLSLMSSFGRRCCHHREAVKRGVIQQSGNCSNVEIFGLCRLIYVRCPEEGMRLKVN